MTRKQRLARLVTATSPLLDMASQLGGVYPFAMKRMIDQNPGRVKAWEAEITTPDAMKAKVKGWQDRGLLYSDAEMEEKSKRDTSGAARVHHAKGDAGVWFRYLSDEQKQDIKTQAAMAKRGSRVIPPPWITREELPMFNTALYW